MKKVDLADSRKITEIVPDRPVAEGMDRTWSSVFLAKYFLPPWETPVLSTSQHLIAVNLAGRSSVELQQDGRWQAYPLEEDSIAIIPAGFVWASRWPSAMKCLHVCLDSSFVARSVYAGSQTETVDLECHFYVKDPLIYHLAMALKAEQDQHQYCDRIYAESLAMALSVHLVKHYSVRKKPLDDYSRNLPQPSLKTAIDFILDNLDQPLSLEALAKLTQMSPSHFAHSFKAALGTSPHQFIVQQRIEKAKHLLQHSDFTVRDIACRCGFSSQSHLDTTFHKHAGVTPYAYRQQVRA